MHKSSVRQAKHAGSWYHATKNGLEKDMDQYFEKIKKQIQIQPKAIKALIGPHAGYKFCGHISAWAYQYFINHPSNPARIFLLGPSHHQYFEGLAISNLTQFQTPIGNLKVDTQCIKQLKEVLVNIELSRKQEQKQHSLQMHLPMIRRIFQDRVKVIPIMVGVIDENIAQKYGKILSKYFDDQNTIFIISSDFCHWGPHFAYQPISEGKMIHQYISELDHRGMELIQKNDSKGFDEYITQTGNTICGQFPIRILMHTIKQSKIKKIQTKFVQYDQSDKVKSFNGSSVSYASAIVFNK